MFFIYKKFRAVSHESYWNSSYDVWSQLAYQAVSGITKYLLQNKV